MPAVRDRKFFDELLYLFCTLIFLSADGIVAVKK